MNALQLNLLNGTFLLRFAVAVILIIHGAGGMFNGGVNAFGELYLDKVGFAPFGLYLAWAIKLSHLVCAVCLLWDKYIFYPAFVTIIILVAGIVMIHGREGWFVVGGGRNGMEFNFLLIFALLMFMFPQGLGSKPKV
jgi:putative oxidoreductase